MPTTANENRIYLLDYFVESEDKRKNSHFVRAYETSEQVFAALKEIIDSEEQDIKWRFVFDYGSNDVVVEGDGDFLICPQDANYEDLEYGTCKITINAIYFARKHNDVVRTNTDTSKRRKA